MFSQQINIYTRLLRHRLALGGSFSSMHVHCMQCNGDRYGKNPALLCRSMHCVADDMCNNEVLFLCETGSYIYVH
jgi:hypothetical protein